MKFIFKTFLKSIVPFIFLFVAGCTMPGFYENLDLNMPTKTPDSRCQQYFNTCSLMPDYETCSACDCNWDSGFCYGEEAPYYWSVNSERASYAYSTQFCPNVQKPEITFIARFPDSFDGRVIDFMIRWGDNGVSTETQIEAAENMVTWTVTPPDSYTEGDLNWQARLNRLGEQTSGYIDMNPCSPISDVIPGILSTPSATPASARDCPAGTYFSETTNRCIAIDLNNLNNGGNSGGNSGGGSGKSCSSYGDYPSCISGGCTWDGGYCQ